jgi:hypothetical protein
MSVEVINAVRGRRFGSALRKSVMYVLADYCDTRWSCFVGQRRIAAEAEVSERTARGILADLEATGVIRREKRYNGFQGRTSDRIYLVREVIASLPATAAANDDLPAAHAALPANDAPLPANDDMSTGSSFAAEPLENRQEEPLGGGSTDLLNPCPDCGSPVIAIDGSRGRFYGCSTHPTCGWKSNQPPPLPRPASLIDLNSPENRRLRGEVA